jgi:hypothetical protein
MDQRAGRRRFVGRWLQLEQRYRRASDHGKLGIDQLQLKRDFERRGLLDGSLSSGARRGNDDLVHNLL